MTAVRKPLPHRRESITTATEWGGHEITVTVGFDPETGEPAEVFAETVKGGDMAAAIRDTCVLISLALQYGVPPDALAKSLGEVPGQRWDTDAQTMVEAVQPASAIGAVMAVVKRGME